MHLRYLGATHAAAGIMKRVQLQGKQVSIAANFSRTTLLSASIMYAALHAQQREQPMHTLVKSLPGKYCGNSGSTDVKF